MAESATIVLRTVTDEAEENIEDVQAELRDLEDQAEETDDSLNMDPDTTRGRKSMRGLADDVEDVGQEARSSRRALERLGRTDAEPDVDVDRNRRGRLPGELDEVQEAVTFISNLRTEAVLAGGAIATLTAGLVGVGGLSAAALQAANNTTVLNDEMAQLKARGRETAREFAQSFSPTLRQDVIPALNRTLALVQSTDDALAGGVGGFFDVLRQFRGTGTPLGLPAAVFTSPEGETGAAGGAAAQIENAILKVQTRLEKATDRFELEELFGLPTEERLNDQISTLEKLRDKLIETLAAVDQSEAPPGAIAKINQRIQDLLDRLEKARGELRGSRLEQQVGDVGVASQVEPAGLATTGIGQSIQEAGLAGSARELGRVGQAAGNAGDDIEQNVNRELQRGVNLASQIGTTLIRSARRGGVEFEQVFGTILSAVGGTLSAIPGVGQIAGPILGGAGRLISAFDQGGVVDTPLQVVGESGPELAALPQGTRVSTARETERMLSQQQVNVNVTGEIRRLRSRELGLILREDETRRNQFGYSS